MAGGIRQRVAISIAPGHTLTVLLVIKRVTRHATQRLASDFAMGARRIVCVRRCPALPSLGSCLVLTANGSLRVSNQQECDLP